MNNISRRFLGKVGFPDHERIAFHQLDALLEQTAKSIPFENLRIIANRTRPISMENLVDKVLVRKEGGLCYELNPLLHQILVEQGFHAVLTRGTVFNQTKGAYAATGSTHVAILLHHRDQTYLVDTGFGGNLPLKPVPLSGDVATSSNGSFKVSEVHTAYGDYVLEMKLKNKDDDWRIGYAFHSGQAVRDFSELNQIQSIIVEHPQSSFNKHPLLTKRTDRGSMTLTDSSFTQWINGTMTKESINHSVYKQYLRQYFGRDESLI